MNTLWRWAGVYLTLMSALTAFGYYNQRRAVHLENLQQRISDLQKRQTQLTLQRFDLLSPLALRQWAEANGYTPMSLAKWGKQP
ncbi:MAG: hypothetical protein IVW51_14510 [Thermaceae bacterium]|nr:hypothetical protein [Thermaceae bacterium]